MPEPAGDGSETVGAALAVMPLIGGAAGAAAAAAAMAYEVTELARLKKDVDELLKGFNGSEAGPGRIGEDWLEQAALAGPGFQEADFLFSTYDVVRQELVTFSKVLGLQMESMKIAIDLAQTGYEDIDDDIRARMSALNTQITDLQRDQNVPVPDPDSGATRAKGDGTAERPAAGGTSTQGY